MDANFIAILDFNMWRDRFVVVSNLQQGVEISYAVKASTTTNRKHDVTGPLDRRQIGCPQPQVTLIRLTNADLLSGQDFGVLVLTRRDVYDQTRCHRLECAGANDA